MIHLTNLLVALVLVESGGVPNPPRGDGGRAIGPLQIHRIAVEDANRIIGRRRYRWEDCQHLEVSLEVATILLTHYGDQLPHPATERDLARIWNGGPDGWRQPSTLAYRVRVKRHLDRLRTADAAPVRFKFDHQTTSYVPWEPSDDRDQAVENPDWVTAPEPG